MRARGFGQRFGGYGWAALGVGLATGCFGALRAYVDKGQASLLYLPVVIACAIRFGFGPAVLGAVLSFLCWNFFFLPPFRTFVIHDPKDLLSLFVFLVAAVTTAHLAAQARLQTRQARAREDEILTLFHASEAISREVHADRLLAALAGQLQALCRVTRCVVFRASPVDLALRVVVGSTPGLPDEGAPFVQKMAEAAFEHDQAIGFGESGPLWTKAMHQAQAAPTPATPSRDLGAYVPLRAAEARVGVLHVGPRADGRPFSAQDERLIWTLANHAATVIARETLAEEAAQAQALRETDTLKNSLLSLVSHELRTPLAAIKASASGLLQNGTAWEAGARDEALAAIDREADRLTALVSNLLDLSRLEAGAWQPAKDWCDIGEIVGTVLDRLPDSEAARVQVSIAPRTPLIRADYTQVVLVLTNLLENAVKYTPGGSPICLTATDAYNGQDESAAGVTLAVRDFGPGLTSGEETRLFERFYRGSTHRASAVHGTGLGLALCQAIVRAHGGRIWAGNAPAGEARGAVFTVFLPAQ